MTPLKKAKLNLKQKKKELRNSAENKGKGRKTNGKRFKFVTRSSKE